MLFSKVDLPAPFGPIKTAISLGLTFRLIPNKTCISLYPDSRFFIESILHKNFSFQLKIFIISLSKPPALSYLLQHLLGFHQQLAHQALIACEALIMLLLSLIIFVGHKKALKQLCQEFCAKKPSEVTFASHPHLHFLQ